MELPGEYIFSAKLPAGHICAPLPEVRVILGGASVLTINDRYTVGGLSYKETGAKTVQLIGLADENTSFTGTVTVPAAISVGEKKFEVTSIGAEAFENSGITGIDLNGATNLKYIGEWAFNGCRSLTGPLTIPESVTEIKDFAFLSSLITSLDLSRAKNLIFKKGHLAEPVIHV